MFYNICPDCEGRGDHDPGYHGCGGEMCRTCNGSGEVTPTGKPSVTFARCELCNGNGKIVVICTDCGGRGRHKMCAQEALP